MDRRKYNSDGNEFDIVPAEVIGVSYIDNNYYNLYNISVRLLYDVSSVNGSSTISAKPFDVSIKKIPLIGEVVYLIRGITSTSSAGLIKTENYYLQSPISVISNINYNGMSGITEVSVVGGGSGELNSINKSNQGYTGNKTKKPKAAFKLNLSEIPLQPFEGDLILEGRSGNSIRCSSTSINNDLYAIGQSFGKGTSNDGDPITIIRNGNLPKSKTIFNVEKIDDNISTIWLTQGQSLNFKNPSDSLSSQSRLGIDSYNIEDIKRSGNQIGLFSDRILLVSKTKEIDILAKNGIALSTNTHITIDSNETIELQSSRINLGIDANEPALLGNTTVSLLTDLIAEIESICTNITSLSVGTGTGPSTPPMNSAAFIGNKTKLTSIRGKLDTLKSELVFLNKT